MARLSDQRTAVWTTSLFTISITRRELCLWVASILAVNHLLLGSTQSGANVFETLAQSFTAKSVFHYLGWYAVIQLLADANTSNPSSRSDIAFALASVVAPLWPWNPALWIAITAVGIRLWLTSRDEPKFQAAGIVLLALAFNGLWAPQLFGLFAPFLLWIDAALVGTALSLTQSGFTWQDTIITSANHSIAILSECSSFHNISLGLLCWIALTKLARPSWVPGDALAGLLVAIAVLMLNTVRVYMMALGPASYAYWHFGFGAQLFAWTTSALVIAISLWGASRRAYRR